MFTGEFNIKVKERERTLKFGTLSFALFCDSEGLELKEITNRLNNPRAFTQINLIHSAAIAHCRLNKIEIDFTVDEVTEWIDEVGEAPLAEMIIKAMKTYIEKNQAAPMRKTGQKKLAGIGSNL